MGLLAKDKKALENSLEEARAEAEAESKGKHDTNLKLKAAQSEIEALNEQLEEESSAKVSYPTKISAGKNFGGQYISEHEI